jgi:RHS repeat-associated protein
VTVRNWQTFTIGTIPPSNQTIPLTQQSTNVYFGGQLIVAEGYGVAVDRLGSVRHGGLSGMGYQAQYPYGVQYSGTQATDREMYATYTRDSRTGLDYAMNRYYSSQWGRFMSPDRSWASARLANPQKLESLCLYPERSSQWQ